MSSSFPFDKKQLITAALIALSLIVYLCTGHFGVLTSAAVVISSAVFALTLLSEPKAFRTLSAIIHILLTLAVSIFIYKDVFQVLVFTASIAAIGAILAYGISKKKEFTDTMIPAIASLAVFGLAAVIYEVWRSGTPISTDSVIDYFISPAVNMANQFSNLTAQNGVPINTTIVLSLIRNMAVGSFCSSVILQVFCSYIICAIMNRWLEFSAASLFDPIKNISISRVGSILFIASAIIDLWSQSGHLKIIATNFYAMMQLPFNLCGISVVYRYMTKYSMKMKTKRIITAILVILSLMPVLNLSSVLAFIGALYNFAVPTKDITNKNS